MDRTAFVARRRELEQLHSFLARALAGQGQVAFVTGEAGSGKTALVSEFARQAQEAHSDLVVVSGNCNAQTGIGDPYLPFREILTQLTGEVEARLSKGAFTADTQQRRRLRDLTHGSLEALVEFGPDLIGVLVPGATLLARVGTLVAKKAGWQDRLEKLVDRKAGLAPTPVVEQSHIFEQLTNVLKALAVKRPLVLMLDDLQWVDAASASLLFHLARRIHGARILIVGTYRPAEVALGRGGERHPLDQVVAEIKRYWGGVWIDLDQTASAEGRRFVDAFLDTEPNHLSEDFRQALFDHANGHPLFTIELLRNMQERGDVRPDARGYWIEGPSLDWMVLPTRVEGVIEERIGRLEEQLRDTLTVASIEGEDFTAQVVARVQAIGDKELVLRLSQELDRQHRLVRERGMDHVGDQRLSLYSFRHSLFQSYLYGHLGQAERAYLHEDVGKVLETLYGDQTDLVAAQLARHFEEAGVREKARHYLQRAGELAYQHYAHEEAAHYFGRALSLAPQTDYASRFALVLAREKVRHMQGTREAQNEDLATLEKLAEALNDDWARATAAMRRASYAEATSDYPAAVAAVQRGIELAQRMQDDKRVVDELLGTGHLIWGDVLRKLYQFAEAQSHLEQALQFLQQIGATQQMATALRVLGNCFLHQDRNTEAASYFEQSLTLSQEIGDRTCAGSCLNNLGIVYAKLGQHERSSAYFKQALTIIREVGDRRSEAKVLSCLGGLSSLLGQYPQAKAYAEQALQIQRDVGDRLGQRMALHNLGLYVHQLGALDEARAYAEQALAIAREVGDRHGEASGLRDLFNIAFDVGDYAQAQACLEAAMAIVQDTGIRFSEGNLLADRAQLALAQGRLAEAQQDVATALTQIEDIGYHLVCYKVLRAAGDPQALVVLSTAYHLVQDQAEKISDEYLRRSFLENDRDNKEVVQEWERLQHAQ